MSTTALDSFIYSSKELFLSSTYSVPGSILGAGRVVNRTDKGILMKLTLYRGRQARKAQIDK